ncbi:MAG: uracil phosphoribosyltransferase [Mycoplasmoidaceae bacterium]
MINIINHPLIKAKLTKMRNIKCDNRCFRTLLFEITQLMTYEISKDFKTKECEIETPICKTDGVELIDKIIIVPILRAGLGMVDGILSLLSDAQIGHIGLSRAENKKSLSQYYLNIPQSANGSILIILDPMLASGITAISAIESIKREFNPKAIYFVSIIASPIGVDSLLKTHNDVKIFTASLDEKLNKKGYIVPGLGDAGRRLFELN